MIGMITASARHHRPCRQRNGTKPKFFNDFWRARACACAQGGVRSESASQEIPAWSIGSSLVTVLGLPPKDPDDDDDEDEGEEEPAVIREPNE
jgi:hypothetical protein